MSRLVFDEMMKASALSFEEVQDVVVRHTDLLVYYLENYMIDAVVVYMALIVLVELTGYLVSLPRQSRHAVFERKWYFHFHHSLIEYTEAIVGIRY